MGFSALGFGPAPNPSRDTDMSSTTLLMIDLPSGVVMRLAPLACSHRARRNGGTGPSLVPHPRVMTSSRRPGSLAARPRLRRVAFQPFSDVDPEPPTRDRP